MKTSSIGFQMRGGKGEKLTYKIGEFFWQLRYAWQRAWRGYDDTEVFDMAFQLPERILVLLKEYRKSNISLFTEPEPPHDILSAEETDAIIDQMIFYFENCDEDRVYKRLYGVGFFDDGYDDEEYDVAKWDAVYAEQRRCQKEAMNLLSKWIWRLWY